MPDREVYVQQIIIRIKEKIRNMPDALVKQTMEEAGEQTSISTVRRIKAEGSEYTGGFNYNLTIKPYARVFLGLADAPVDISFLKTEEEKDFATLDNLIQMKNREIERLEEELARERDRRERAVGHLIKEAGRKDKILDERAAYLRLKDRAITTLAIALGAALILLYVALGTDAIIPHL